MATDLPPANWTPPKSVVPPAIERLRTHELAFLRAAIRGVPWREAAERYLFDSDTRIDERVVRRRLMTWRSAFARAAARAGDPDLARDIPLGRLIPVTPKTPKIDPPLTYEQWRDKQPPGFFKVYELEEAYKAWCADVTGTAVKREKPLGTWDVKDALAALEQLAPALTDRPHAHHPVAGWLGAGVAQRLEEAGEELATLGELVTFMNRHGSRWYSRVPGIGRRRAMAIARWLATEAVAGDRVTALATTPRTRLDPTTLAMLHTRAGGIVPLERIVLSFELSGVDGTNRDRQRVCQLNVHDDRDAIVRWLHAVATNENTSRAYQREAERVLAWCVYEKGKPLSSMTVDDVIEYREFLVALAKWDQPWHWRTRRGDWVGEKNHPRSSPNWRPFEGKMSRSSIERSLRVARSLFRWLQQIGYLAGDPWAAVNCSLKSHTAFRTAADTSRHVQEKSLSLEELAAVRAVAESLESHEARARATAILALGALAGLRREELASATTEWLVRAGRGRMTLKITGKGGVPRDVPLLAEVELALADYLEARGLPRVPQKCPKQTPLIARLRDEPGAWRKTAKSKAAERHPDALTPARIYAITRRLIERAASALEAESNEDGAKQLRGRAFAHALRHTFGTQCAERGVPVPVVQAWMGHRKAETTGWYFSPRAGQLFDVMDQAFAEEPILRRAEE